MSSNSLALTDLRDDCMMQLFKAARRRTMAEQFQPGDVVRLKSGGPDMTVADVGDSMGTPMVWCVWFDEKKTRQEATFPPKALEKQ